MIDAQQSAPDLIVLHSLRCAGFASVDRLRALVGAALDDHVEDLLLELAVRGLVTHTGGAFGGWGLTDEGTETDAERIAEELERAGARRDVHAAYEDFVELNGDLLDICAAWQMWIVDGTPVLNDHTDQVHDANVLSRLAALDVRVQPICIRLADRLERFSRYGPRLATALERAQQGEHDLVADSLDSYHSVWFQLHEDLLTTLGLTRET